VVTPIQFVVSGNLAPKEGKENEWSKRFIPEMRERIQDEIGVGVPGVRIQSNETDLPDDTYIIMLDEVPIARGRVSSGAKYSPSAPSALQAAGVPVSELEEAIHPLSKQPGCWVPQKYCDRVQQAGGCSLWPDPMQFAIAHLEAVLRNNLANFLGIQEVWDLLERWGQTDRDRELIETALPDALARERFVRVLRALVRELAPITASESILATIREVGLLSDETSEIVRRVRLAIKRDLPGNRPGAKLVTVPPEIERAILLWTNTADGRRFFAIPSREAQELLAKIRGLVQGDNPAVVLVTEDVDVRDPLSRLVELEFPNITVQSREETLSKEDRETPLVWVPRIAEWGELWPQNMETCNAS
jgi:flagellar biosynthesis component FlhA